MNNEPITKQQAIDLAESLRPIAGNGITEAFIKGVEGVESWISVKDRLPNANGNYLCINTYTFGDEPHIMIRSFANNLESVNEYDFEGNKTAGWFDYDSEAGFYEVYTVTHWMPLPEPPKE